jgi:uncharacterized protein YutE (UPF0331/DUF86 family)
MVDEHLVTQRLAAIADRLARIDAVLPAARAQFLADRTAQEVVSFNLFVAFQDALDLAAHLIADRRLELPTTAREHFEVLARAGLISTPAAAGMTGCAGLRNLIAHAYGSLDVGRMYDELPAGRDALAAFCAEVATIGRG